MRKSLLALLLIASVLLAACGGAGNRIPLDKSIEMCYALLKF